MKKIDDSLFEKSKIYDLESIQGGMRANCFTTKHEGTNDHATGHVTCDHSKDKCQAEIQ